MSILIKDIIVNGKEQSVYIKENKIQELGEKLKLEADYVINGKGKALIPGLVNTHTHAAMCLFRSYAEELELEQWLQEKIWPLEKRLKPEDVYWGTKLACLEMIKSGTTCFNDMYFFMEEAAKAVKELGLRAVLSEGYIDLFDPERKKIQIERSEKVVNFIKELNSPRIRAALGPHAIYTVSEESLLWAKEYAAENKLLVHFHLAETRQEAENFLAEKGKRIVTYLEQIGFLSENLVCAHSIWLTDKEIEILRKHQVKISYNPISNLKLGSGIMPYENLKSLTVSLGTDGTASNNNLDIFDTMKFAALVQKLSNIRAITAQEVFDLATVNGALTLRLNAGSIKEGKLADLLIIDLKRPELTPGYDLISDLVYSASGACVETVICDGKILMENRKVQGEEEILEKAKEVAFDLVTRGEK